MSRHTEPVLPPDSAAADGVSPTAGADYASEPEPDGRVPYVVERAGWVMVWLAVLGSGVSLCSYWSWSPFVVVLAAVMVLGGIVGIAWCWVVKTPRSALFQGIGLASALVAVVFPKAIEISTRTFYGNDAAAFDQVAARALTHGIDPYVASMRSVARLLMVPARSWTYTVTGGHVSHFSYPAGSALIDASAMMLGFHHMVVDWVDLLAWLVTVVIIFVLLDKSVRWLALLIALSASYLVTFTAGGTDAMFLPFMVLAVWRWDRYGQGANAGLARWLGPVALGIACSIKQTPWFCVPLLVVGLYVEASRTARPACLLCMRYLSTVLLVFTVVNLPFVIWQPSAWLHGTLTPLLGGLVANGQGLVALATHGVTGGVNLTMLSLASVLAILLSMAVFLRWYTQLKRVWVVLAVVPLFFAPRSLATYLLDLLPIAVVAALSVGDAPGTSLRLPGRRWGRVSDWSGAATALLVAGTLGVSACAFTGAPLQLSLRSIVTSGHERVLDEVVLTVRNRTDYEVTPHFMVDFGGGPEGFWTTKAHRSVVVGPHAVTTVMLYSPAHTSGSCDSSKWLVEAYTRSPTFLSTSALEPCPTRGPERDMYGPDWRYLLGKHSVTQARLRVHVAKVSASRAREDQSIPRIALLGRQRKLHLHTTSTGSD